MSTNPTPWIQQLTPDSYRTIANFTGLSHTTISRAAASETPSPHIVVTIARAYGHNPVKALETIGLLTPSEIETYTPGQDLKHIPTRVLLQELLRRESAV